VGNDESILLGFMKYVSDALNQHGNHKCLMKGWDTPEGISWVSFCVCFRIMAYSMASVHKTYNIQIARNMRNDIVVNRNECMHMADITHII